jgi:hypothetical protein
VVCHSQPLPQVAELPQRVSAVLLSLMTNAVYDLESLKKVRTAVAVLLLGVCGFWGAAVLGPVWRNTVILHPCAVCSSYCGLPVAADPT